jgi:hypothetical protein
MTENNNCSGCGEPFTQERPMNRSLHYGLTARRSYHRECIRNSSRCSECGEPFTLQNSIWFSVKEGDITKLYHKNCDPLPLLNAPTPYFIKDEPSEKRPTYELTTRWYNHICKTYRQVLTLKYHGGHVFVTKNPKEFTSIEAFIDSMKRALDELLEKARGKHE